MMPISPTDGRGHDAREKHVTAWPASEAALRGEAALREAAMATVTTEVTPMMMMVMMMVMMAMMMIPPTAD
jgi:hypothetical protein